LADVTMDLQGAGGGQDVTPLMPDVPVQAGDGGQLRTELDTPAERSPHERSLVHQHEVASFVIPLEYQIEQSASFVFKSEFIQSNSQYKERINAVTLGVQLEDPTVNAYATDDPSPQIIVMGGMARAMRVSAAGLSLHMQLREKGADPIHLRRLFQHLGEGIVGNQGTFPQQVGEELYSECMGEEIDAAFESGTDRFVSLARDFGAVMEMYVIAHEAGHIALGHTLGPTLSYDMSRNQEREADSFASSCLSTSPFRDKLFLGQVFATVILAWMDHAAASDEVSTHPSSHDRFLSALRSNKDAAEDAAEQYGLTTDELQGFLPTPGGG
ncbi:MAG: phage exclusion protein Lit family protein, partial [Pirellulaceae bacterium]|nr:phage exclusion protein Lit family protein [Pirellulaceae bacterium]